MELISAMRPAPWARITGSAACTTRTQPQKLVSSCAFASPTEVSSTGPATPQPAAVTTASMRPCAASTAPTPARTLSSSSTSMTSPLQPPAGQAGPPPAAIPGAPPVAACAAPVVPRLLAPTTVQPALCR